jgi:hypothetical protein
VTRSRAQAGSSRASAAREEQFPEVLVVIGTSSVPTLGPGR